MLSKLHWNAGHVDGLHGAGSVDAMSQGRTLSHDFGSLQQSTVRIQRILLPELTSRATVRPSLH